MIWSLMFKRLLCKTFWDGLVSTRIHPLTVGRAPADPVTPNRIEVGVDD